MLTESSSSTPLLDHPPLLSAAIDVEAIERLALQEQVPLAADRLPSGRGADIANRTANDDRLYVRLGVPLPVAVETKQSRIHMRADWERMYWGPYTAVARGLREVIAGNLYVKADALALNKLLVVEADRATQYVEIVVPQNHAERFTSVDTQANVKTFLRAVKGEPLPFNVGDASGVAHDSYGAEGQTHLADEAQGGPSRAIELAREVRAAVGGTTLPAACIIEASGWQAPMQLSGRLGDKLRAVPSAPKERIIDCRLDGYIKSQRLVHLMPVSTREKGKARSDGRKIVAYDEEKWFTTIAVLAAKQDQLVRATYREVIDGKKERLQLTNLEAVADRENHTPCPGTPARLVEQYSHDTHRTTSSMVLSTRPDRAGTRATRCV
jgi:hypothetical protein